MAGETKLRVCSVDPSHDVSEAAAWSSVCPQCGASLIDAADSELLPPHPREPELEPALEPGQSFPADEPVVEPTSSTELLSNTDPPPYPAPALICAKVPAHDLSKAAEHATTCPQPHCGGRLIQLECGKDVAHDVVPRPAGSFVCPICGSPLLTPVCKTEPGHAMVQRPAGGTVCPLDGGPLERVVYVPPMREKKPPVDPPELPWWQRVRSPLAAALALLVIVVVVIGVRRVLAPADPCAAVPKNLNEALQLAIDHIKAEPPPAQLRAEGDLNLKCHALEPALRLLRHAAEKKDAGATIELGQLRDPSYVTALRGPLPTDVAIAAKYYAQAADAHDSAVRPDLERLLAWLSRNPNDTNAAARVGAASALEHLQ